MCKASNNISVVCKKFYVEHSMKELDIFLNSSKKKDADKTYVPVKESLEFTLESPQQVYESSFY